MDCTKEKHSYHFNVTQVVDGKIQDVMSCNFECHHDLAALCQKAEHEDGLSKKHACQLVLGLRLLHHALKKNTDKPEFATFLAQLDDFKHKLKATTDCGCPDDTCKPGHDDTCHTGHEDTHHTGHEETSHTH